MNTEKIYDFIGIGVGPFNLGLACLTQPIKGLDGLFLDKSQKFDWHPGMMIEGTTLQIPFLADLVTLADPTSKFSFLNYLKEKGNIYSFYIKENFLLLRKEYNQYCQWAIQKLNNIEFDSEVKSIQYDETKGIYELTIHRQQEHDVQLKTRKLILGTGTVPHVPKAAHPLKDVACHTAHYLSHKEALQEKKSISVVGSGQSAAEVFYDLLQEAEKHQYELNWITRSPRFFPLEYTKLTLEMTSPEYVDYFYALPDSKRKQLLKEQKGLYKGINQDLIGAIYDALYAQKINGHQYGRLQTNCELIGSEYDPIHQKANLSFKHIEQHKKFNHQTEGVVLATGYAYQKPSFINSIAPQINWNHDMEYEVSRNYAIDKNQDSIYVQNAEIHTHGFVTPDLGMAAYRNSILIKEILGREFYPIETKIAFQEFGVLPQEELFAMVMPN